jgi:hypothetical protein
MLLWEVTLKHRATVKYDNVGITTHTLCASKLSCVDETRRRFVVSVVYEQMYYFHVTLQMLSNQI